MPTDRCSLCNDGGHCPYTGGACPKCYPDESDRQEGYQWAADHSENHDPGFLRAIAVAYAAGKASGRTT